MHADAEAAQNAPSAAACALKTHPDADAHEALAVKWPRSDNSQLLAFSCGCCCCCQLCCNVEFVGVEFSHSSQHRRPCSATQSSRQARCAKLSVPRQLHGLIKPFGSPSRQMRQSGGSSRERGVLPDAVAMVILCKSPVTTLCCVSAKACR